MNEPTKQEDSHTHSTGTDAHTDDAKQQHDHDESPEQHGAPNRPAPGSGERRERTTRLTNRRVFSRLVRAGRAQRRPAGRRVDHRGTDPVSAGRCVVRVAWVEPPGPGLPSAQRGQRAWCDLDEHRVTGV